MNGALSAEIREHEANEKVNSIPGQNENAEESPINAEDDLPAVSGKKQVKGTKTTENSSQYLRTSGWHGSFFFTNILSLKSKASSAACPLFFGLQDPV